MNYINKLLLKNNLNSTLVLHLNKQLKKNNILNNNIKNMKIKPCPYNDDKLYFLKNKPSDKDIFLL